MSLPPNSLPLRIHFAPSHPRLPGLVCPFPDSDILFLGWGSIGPNVLPTTPDGWCDEMRATLRRIRYSRRLTKGENIVVLGCERIREWGMQYSLQWKRIDHMLTMITAGMKGVYGIDVPFAYSGPEDGKCGDFYTPMIGPQTRWNPVWDWGRRVLPFISPIYGATVDHAADLVIRLTSGPGVPLGICLWCQSHDLAGQQATVDFGLAVNDRWIKHLAAVSAAEGEVSE